MSIVLEAFQMKGMNRRPDAKHINHGESDRSKVINKVKDLDLSVCVWGVSSVNVNHLWHVEDSLTGLEVPQILFLTDPQNSYFFKSPILRQRMINGVDPSGSSFFCYRRRI